MERFGTLPESFDLVQNPIDPYETDQAYGRSFWYQPAVAGNASLAGRKPGRK